MRWFWQTPFYNVETGNPILPPYSIQITTQDSHSHTGTTSAGGGHITAPLIGLWIISGQERREKRSSIIVFPDLFIEKTREWTIKKVEENLQAELDGSPLYRIEVRWAVVTSHCIQQVVQNTDTDSASPFTHRRYHPPLVGLGVVSLHTGDSVTTAPATNYR